MKRFRCLSSLLLLLAAALARAETKPNVVIIVTDDQGFGELGVTGNPLVRTPHIDALAKQSASLTDFSVMPVCSPTRACLMTGRYNYRTGVVDTFMGRSLMDPRERTLPEMLAAGGYRTGIFGKWHLGDNFPMRAMDRGFAESLVLNGGGLAQPGDPPDPVDERGAYFNATLRHNGEWVKTDGYVSDVITTAAMKFIEENRGKPFMVYLPFNCPHSPHQVPAEYRAHYRPEDFANAPFPRIGHPMSAKYDPDDLARVYGMIENIDDNVGRLLGKLQELKLSENTIVVLFSDNGCQKHNGYNAGLQGWKGTPWQGGIHQFCFLRWPGHFFEGRKIPYMAAPINLAPTLLDLCHVQAPADVRFDGWSFAPVLLGAKWEQRDRTLCFQWHRGDAPERYRSFAARTHRWKLVQPLGAETAKWNPGAVTFQLYDILDDPLEMHDLAAERPEIVADLKARYDAWFDDVTKGRDYSAPPRISIGAPQENPLLLTQQDRRTQPSVAPAKDVGCWEVNVERAGTYDVQVLLDPPQGDAEVTCTLGDVTVHEPVAAGAGECLLKAVHWPAGAARFMASITENGQARGVKYVRVRRLDE